MRDVTRLKSLIIIATFLLGGLILGRAQTPLGIGMTEIEFNASTIVEFYNNPKDKAYAKRIEFFDDKSINSWSIRDIEKVKVWLKPESMWLDYHHFVFRTTTVDKYWLEVIINNEDGSTYWIKRTKEVIFNTWESYLQGMFAIDRLAEEKQKIRTNPSDGAAELPYQGRDCFQVKSMKGDWIEIATSGHCSQEKITQIKSGWIRWRRGDKLLIYCYPTS
jgi:hypothetical protein